MSFNNEQTPYRILNLKGSKITNFKHLKQKQKNYRPDLYAGKLCHEITDVLTDQKSNT